MPIPWFVLRRRRRRRLLVAADDLMDALVALAPDDRQGVYGVGTRTRPSRVIVYLAGAEPVPPFIPATVDGFPVVVERRGRAQRYSLRGGASEEAR